MDAVVLRDKNIGVFSATLKTVLNHGMTPNDQKAQTIRGTLTIELFKE